MFGSQGFGQGYFGQGPISGVLVDVEESGALATITDAVLTAMALADTVLPMSLTIQDRVLTAVTVADAVVVT